MKVLYHKRGGGHYEHYYIPEMRVMILFQEEVRGELSSIRFISDLGAPMDPDSTFYKQYNEKIIVKKEFLELGRCKVDDIVKIKLKGIIEIV